MEKEEGLAKVVKASCNDEEESKSCLIVESTDLYSARVAKKYKRDSS